MKIVIMILIYSLSLSTFASQWRHSFFAHEPAPLSTFAKSNITKAQFKSLLKKIKKTYTKRIHKKGGLFKVKAKWNSKRVNAYASRIGPIWKLTALGGLARHPMINYDGFAIVLCHEMGHHLGGAPKSTVYFKRWVSYEGQADYWATLKCFRTLFEKENNIAFVAKNFKELPVLASLKCMETYPNQERAALCIRSIMAGKVMANLIADYHDVSFPSLDTPDAEIVDTTSYQHPSAQCRLDTYFQAAICPVSESSYVSDIDPAIGTCSRMNGQEIQGSRPLCWYRPQL